MKAAKAERVEVNRGGEEKGAPRGVRVDKRSAREVPGIYSRRKSGIGREAAHKISQIGRHAQENQSPSGREQPPDRRQGTQQSRR